MPPKLVYYVRVWGRNARPTQDMGMPPQENTMNYATIKYCDIANGEGVRTSLFVSGCRRHCPNCFNAVAWDFGYGAPFTKEVRNEILERLARGDINGLSLLGGDPFEPENLRELLHSAKPAHTGKPNNPAKAKAKTSAKSEDSAKSSSESKNNVSPKKHTSQKNQRKPYAKDSAKSFGKKKK